MAKGDKEHQMLFDLRGKRRNVVKVVYATLAVLMGLSLFLVIGGFNIAELFSSGTGTGNAAEIYEEQIERIEGRLEKEPEDPNLLTALTRAHINAGNSQITTTASGEESFSLEAIQQWEQAYQSWSDYLKATDEPSGGLALLVSPTLVRLAELSGSFQKAAIQIQAAVDAQKIAAKRLPSVNSFTTLAQYTYFTDDFPAAEKARAQAKKLATGKPEREAIDKQLDESKKRAEKFLQEKERSDRQLKAAREKGGSAGAPEGGETPEAASPEAESPLGGALGGGLTE